MRHTTHGSDYKSIDPRGFTGLESVHILEVLEELQQLRPVDGLFVREYSPKGRPDVGCAARKYLTAENAAHADAIRLRLRKRERRGRTQTS